MMLPFGTPYGKWYFQKDVMMRLSEAIQRENKKLKNWKTFRVTGVISYQSLLENNKNFNWIKGDNLLYWYFGLRNLKI